MKTLLTISLQVLLPFCFILSVRAQTPWINAIPTLYHPSFAGSTDQWRVATNNSINFDRYTYTGNFHVENLTNQNMLSADKFVAKIHTGIGFGFRYSNELKPFPNDKIDFMEGNITVAPKFSLNGKYTISPSLQFTMGEYQSRITYNYFSFQDSISQIIENNYYSRNISLKGGLMFNSRKFFVGATYYFVFSSSSNFRYPGIGRETFYKPKFLERLTFIAGYTFRKSPESNFSFTPVLLLGSSSFQWNVFLMEERHVNLYATAKYKKFIAGLDLFLNVMVGYENKRLRLMLVQRYWESNIPNIMNRGYSAQVSLRYQIGKM